ncbi:hypothetical protein Tco_0869086 [Tanacetum coccineum]
MPTEMELTLEQTQQGVSYEVSVFTMKMEILLEPTSNKLMVEHAEYDESNTYVLERFNTTAGNPVKKILLKLNLSDHRLFKDGGGDENLHIAMFQAMHLVSQVMAATNFCLSYGEPHTELSPQTLRWFRRKGIHVVHVSPDDEYVVALDFNGYVWNVENLQCLQNLTTINFRWKSTLWRSFLLSCSLDKQ